jgi:glycosyl hydrolase family 42 (putative beta-galactosidase)
LNKSRIVSSKAPFLWHGGDYTPEQWPREVWEEDFRRCARPASVWQPWACLAGFPCSRPKIISPLIGWTKSWMDCTPTGFAPSWRRPVRRSLPGCRRRILECFAVRHKEYQPIVFVLNHNAEPAKIQLGSGAFRSLLTGEVLRQEIVLDGYGVNILAPA